jgi:putative transposase
MNKVISKPIKLLPGATVTYKQSQFVVTDILDLESVIAKNVDTHKSQRILVKDISSDNVIAHKQNPNNLEVITDEDWQEANRRFSIIKPIIEAGRGRRVITVKQASEQNDVSQATLYRWLSNYEQEQRISSLIRPTRKDKGLTRIDTNVEEIITKQINTSFLSEERPTPTHVWKLIKSECLAQGLPIPHANTIRNRIGLLSEELKISKRHGKEASRNKFRPTLGSFPNADYPLAVVQIDHSPMDIIVVDDVNREPIGRPFLTCAIDVYSKVVVGYYISLDPVGALSTGLCLSHAILPKEAWLAKMDITTSYPVWGKMKVIHSDNAKEFHGKMLARACKEHNITTEKRPKGQPQYGGHIERAFGTYMREIHNLPGTTRSNVKDKGSYDSEGKACMTLEALEQWFAIFIVECYHHQAHQGNQGVSPIVAYERGLLGDSTRPGIGLPERIADEYKLKLDFMPFELRTVQEYGILLNDIFYYHDSLKRWIHSTDPEDRKSKLKFVCRYDPRDLSKIFFYEPDNEQYIEVPYSDITKPPISIWELRAVKKKIKEDGHSTVNEELIFTGLRRMNEIVEREHKKTKSARIQKAKQTRWIKAKEHTTKSEALPVQPQKGLGDIDDIFSKTILPFEDIEESA